jgi:hypothetical protein
MRPWGPGFGVTLRHMPIGRHSIAGCSGSGSQPDYQVVRDARVIFGWPFRFARPAGDATEGAAGAGDV